MAPVLLLLSVLSLLGPWPGSLVLGASTRTPAPWQMFFNNSKSVGPDGPWRVVTIGVGFPDQWCDLYPGGQGATVLVSREVCQQQNLTCPSPPVQLYNPDKNQAESNDSARSEEIAPSQWDSGRAQALNLTGRAQYHLERLFVRDDRESHFVEDAGVLVSSGYASQYAGGAHVPLSVGLLGMGTSAGTVGLSMEDGSTANFATLLGGLASQGVITSRSWGLHIGSVRHNISGSLVFGGYDQSRILGEVATFDSETARIVNITTQLVDRAHMELEYMSPLDTRFYGLRSSHTVEPIGAVLDASVPYMYLPTAVCESMARALDLDFDPSLQLYLWKRVDAASHVNTSSHISFQFSDSRDKDVTVRVPLALLNLTLESPLVAQPTPYFPCRPIPAGDAQSVRLGRAFLQAAFVGRNWESGKLFVAQAPGPRHRDLDIKRISGSDTTLAPPVNPPSWNSTWVAVLGSLPSSAGPDDPNRDADRSNSEDSDQSEWAASMRTNKKRIRIGVGVAVPLVILLSVAGVTVFLCRRRRQRRWGQQEAEQVKAASDSSAEGWGYCEAPGDGSYPWSLRELPGHDVAHEVDSKESYPKAVIRRGSI